jgi:hypothetical protein
MIDPVSISVAFAAAQTAVKTIKAAVQLGKDISQMSGELNTFFSSSAKVYSAQGAGVKLKKPKTEAELGSQALSTVMAANKLRTQEKELKELFIYSGNAHLWEQMLEERTRLILEQRAEIRKAEAAAKEKKALIIESIQIVAIVISIVIVAIVGIALAYT